MPLESLYKIVEVLSERISRHSDLLRNSEAMTRYSLVDPLLRELGWDTDDPEQLWPEYNTDPGMVDYALLRGGEPVMLVEAKKLDTSLRQHNVLSQVFNYCMMLGTRYFALTDGQR